MAGNDHKWYQNKSLNPSGLDFLGFEPTPADSKTSKAIRVILSG